MFRWRGWQLRRALTVLAFCAAFATVANPWLVALRAQGTAMFTMDMASPDGYDFCGGNPTDGSSGQWQNNGVYYNYAQRAGQGPTGGNAAELALIAVTPPVMAGRVNCTDLASCQDYLGWGCGSYSATEITQGSSLYVRFYIRFTDWDDPRKFNGNPVGGKMVLIGEGCSTPDRPIINLEGTTTGASNAPRFQIDKNIQGVGFSTAALSLDTWHAVQVEFQSSSTAIATDGTINYWLNTDVEGTPTQSAASGFAWPNASCFNDHLRLGAYSDWMMTTAGNGIATWQYGGFEVSTGFDASWHADMGGASPAVAPAVRPRSFLRSAWLYRPVWEWL